MDETTEEDEESSSVYGSISYYDPPQPSDALAKFRDDWRQELAARTFAAVQNGLERPDFQASNELYKLAVLHEQSGLVTEAVSLYRRAFKLFPEAEERYWRPALQDQNAAKKDTVKLKSKSSIDDSNETQETVPDSDNPEIDTKTFKALLPIDAQTNRLLYCSPSKKNKTETRHFGTLPAELLVHIFKWVVSSHMDIRQLEQLSMVCSGFYVLCRDPELWKLICMRNCLSKDYVSSCDDWKHKINGKASNDENALPSILSWRQLYLQTPHLLYSGVYISKISYIRSGENNSFQDRGFCQQWHLVSYFRYLRFFADGTVAMITSADEPMTILPGLKWKSSLATTAFVGTYNMTNSSDKIGHLTAIVRRLNRKTRKDTPQNRHHSKERGAEADQVFLMEFQIKPLKKRGNYQLIWMDYFVKLTHANGHEATSRISLTEKNFPPLFFSRVRSYTAACEFLLE